MTEREIIDRIEELRAQNTQLGEALNDLTARLEQHLSTPPPFSRRLWEFLRVLVDPWLILNVIFFVGAALLVYMLIRQS